jgi:hypothetical protein
VTRLMYYRCVTERLLHAAAPARSIAVRCGVCNCCCSANTCCSSPMLG